MYRPPPPTISSRSPLLGIRNWDNGTTTDENGTFQVWGCCGNLCRQPSNQRACRVFFPCPLARGWVAGLARRYCVRALEPVRGGCNLSDSDPSPARCQLKKQTSPTSCSGLGCWSQSFATLPTRKNPARHASLVRQPRPITTRTHPTVGSMSPLPRRLRLVRRTDAIGFQNRRGMRLNRRGGAGIVRLFFSLASNDDVTVGIGAMMEWMSQEPMRPAPSSHCDDKVPFVAAELLACRPTSRSSRPGHIPFAPSISRRWHFSFVVLQGWEIQNCSRSRSRVHLPLLSAHCGVGLVRPSPFLFVATPYDALA